MPPIRRGLLVAALLLVPAFTLGPATAREPAPGDETTPTPGVPIPEDSELGVVHSWALAPAGAGDGSQSGDRANLTYEMAPGTLVQDRVTLFNFSNVPLEFELFPIDAVNNDDGSFTPVDRGADQKGVGAWITLPVDSMQLDAGQSASFDILVSVPPDAQPGDHAGAVLAANVARGTGPDGRVVNFDRQTGTRVYIRVDGPLQPELAVESLGSHYTPSLNPLEGSAEVTYRIENRGNVRLAGTHRVSLSGPFGLLETSGQLHELPELLPGESLEFTETIDGVAATVASFASVDLEPTAVDPLDAEIVAEDRRAVGIAVPYLLVAILAAAVFVWVARRRYKRHRDDLESDEPFDDLVLEHRRT